MRLPGGVWGTIPWKKGYGGYTRAIRYPNGTVYRLNGKNTLYRVSERLAKQFREDSYA